MIAGALALLRLVAANLIPVLAIAGAGTILWMRAELVEIRAERARLDQQLVQAEADLRQAAETAAVHRAHIERMAAEDAAWAQLTRDLQSMEGRDAPLSDHNRAVAGRLWP